MKQRTHRVASPEILNPTTHENFQSFHLPPLVLCQPLAHGMPHQRRGTCPPRDERVRQPLHALASHPSLVLEQHTDQRTDARSAAPEDGGGRWLWRLRHPAFRHRLPSGLPVRRLFPSLRCCHREGTFPGRSHVYLRRVRLPERQHGSHQRLGRHHLHEQSSGPDRQATRQDRVPRWQWSHLRPPTLPQRQTDVAGGMEHEHEGGDSASRLLRRGVGPTDMEGPGGQRMACDAVPVRHRRRPQCRLPFARSRQPLRQ